MPRTNAENSEWIDLHNGSRVPINDNDVEGAPFTLYSNDPDWDEGSVNKAVYDTYILNQPIADPEDAEDGELGVLDYITLLRYVNKDMLYGYNGDARGKIIGNFTGFRGYPTPVLSDELLIVEPYSTVATDLDGTGKKGKFLLYSHSVNLAHKLPYDVVYTVTHTVNASNVYENLEYRVQSGALSTTHYRDTVADDLSGVTTWIPIRSGSTYYVDTSSSTGNITINIQVVSIAQAPYYGTFNLLSEIVTEAQYSPVTPPDASQLQQGLIKEITDLPEYLTQVEKCNEWEINIDILGIDLVLPLITLYKKDSDPLAIGTILYKDSAATIPAVTQTTTYAFFSYVYSREAGEELDPEVEDIIFQIYTSTLVLTLDANSVITYIAYPDRGYQGAGCYV